MAAGNFQFAGSAERERSSGAVSGSTRPSTSPHPPDQQQQQGQQQQQRTPRVDETMVVVRTTNFSFAPGPVWLEAVNTVAINVATVKPVTIDVPKYGGGQLLQQGLNDVLLLAILAPQGPPFDQELRFGDEAHVPFPPDYHWWPKYSHQPVSSVSPAMLDPNLPAEQLQKLQEKLKKEQEEEEKKAREAMDKAKQQEQEQQKAEQQKQQPNPQKQQQQARDAQARIATPIPGTVDQWLQTTGMSAQGFPGFPRAINRTMAKGTATSGLPTTAGISYIDCWQSTDAENDWDIDVYFVGTGTIPIGQRWLFMTLRGI